jgi:dTDP-glucose 4,6-dehydratase
MVNMNKKKLMITGSCGFIPGNLVRKLIYEKHPYSIVSIDRVNDNVSNSIYWNDNHKFYVADIRDQHIIDTIFRLEQPDIVIHAAAETFVDYSLSDPNAFITSNVLGTQVIINACLKSNVDKLIYISTDEVYGQLADSNASSWKETDPMDPRNPYSVSKAAGEMLVKAAHNAFGLKYIITRSSNNYGLRQTPEKLIPKVIKCIENNEKIPVYGQGLQVRDWTHVFDNCAAIIQLLKNGKDNEIYNISANQEIQNIEVVQKICDVMNKGHNLVEFVKDRPAHDFRYSIDCSKIKELGWKPITKFKDGIVSTVEWYKANKWFLK